MQPGQPAIASNNAAVPTVVAGSANNNDNAIIAQNPGAVLPVLPTGSESTVPVMPAPEPMLEGADSPSASLSRAAAQLTSSVQATLAAAIRPLAGVVTKTKMKTALPAWKKFLEEYIGVKDGPETPGNRFREETQT